MWGRISNWLQEDIPKRDQDTGEQVGTQPRWRAFLPVFAATDETVPSEDQPQSKQSNAGFWSRIKNWLLEEETYDAGSDLAPEVGPILVTQPRWQRYLPLFLLAGGAALLVGAALLPEAAVGAAGEVAVLETAAEEAGSILPTTVARVIPNGIPATTLGAPGAADVFVTTPEALEGLDAAGIAEKLTIPKSPTGFRIFEFPTPKNGLASPIFRNNPGFVGGGRTLGGAPEFVIPNGLIPADAIVRTVP